MSIAARARERRVIRKLEARGMKGLGQALVQLRGTQVDGRWELGCLYAVGAEGAVYLCHDVWDAKQPTRVAKIALLPYHKPFALSFDEVDHRRERMRSEAGHLERSASSYMPEFLGLHQFTNPLLDPERGGAFAEPEPVLVMERLPGFDLDYWLARIHSSDVPRMIVRRNVDHVAVVVLRGLWDLHEKGYFYTDLRPGNIRIRGRSEHRVRLMDAGSLVARSDASGGFPHVPAYLPEELFRRSQSLGPEVLVPTLQIQAVMAGRTLFEVATGRVPRPGEPVDSALLKSETVSHDVAEVIAGLADGAFKDVFQALKTLAKRTRTKAARAAKAKPAGAPPEPEQPSGPIVAAAPVTVTARDLASVLAAARAKMSDAAAAQPVASRPAAAAKAAPAAATATATAPAAAAPKAKAAPRPAPAVTPVVTPLDDDILPPSRAKIASWWKRAVAFLRDLTKE